MVRMLGGDTGTEVGSLIRWLSQDDELRQQLSPEPKPIRVRQTGGAADILVVALGAHGAGTVLAASLTAWIQHRRPRSISR